MRNIDLNAHYIALFKSPRDKQQISMLARQVDPGRVQEFMRSYEDATNRPHSAFSNYISGEGNSPPPQGKNLPPPPVKPFLPPKCEAELLMIAVRIAVDLLDNEIMPFHSLLHSHLVCDSYCSSPSIS
jgi:hypothetical protein